MEITKEVPTKKRTRASGVSIKGLNPGSIKETTASAVLNSTKAKLVEKSLKRKSAEVPSNPALPFFDKDEDDHVVLNKRLKISHDVPIVVCSTLPTSVSSSMQPEPVNYKDQDIRSPALQNTSILTFSINQNIADLTSSIGLTNVDST